MSLLFVCTFNKKFFHSASTMIESFLKKQTDGHLLLCVEDYEELFPAIPQSDRITVFDLAQYPFLTSWLKRNEDIIPTRHGGKLASCRCQPLDNWIGHSPKCAFGGYRGRASCWFRKIAALKYVYDNFSKYKYVMGIDCDIVFQQNIPVELVDKHLNDYDVMVHLGRYRHNVQLYVEAGLIGFNFEKRGKGFLQTVFNIFTLNEFRSRPRWDDSYMYWHVMQGKQFKVNDVSTGPSPVENPSQSILQGPFARHVVHNKGDHVQLIR